ncbi:Cupredoxin [Bisporella sp. PMI_857]|nr:Cupredoxin [Bisporella sp. PMI_857]
MLKSLATLLALAAAVSAANIDIDVGEDGITFNPDTITAAVGDKLLFHFYPGTGPHSVVRSSFAAPCVPLEGANTFFSGLLAGTADGSQTFEVEVQDTSPIWVYCSARQHCTNGMSAVINVAEGNNTLDAYKAAAAQVSSPSALPSATGGVLTTVAPSESSSTGSSGSGTATSSRATTTSSGSGTRTTSTGAGAASTSSRATSSSTGAAPRNTGVVMGLAAVAGGIAGLLI